MNSSNTHNYYHKNKSIKHWQNSGIQQQNYGTKWMKQNVIMPFHISTSNNIPKA